jgi:hypothetical protein
LALAAGIEGGPGVHVNAFLETSAPRVYAADDIAWWPEAVGGARIHVEHWAVAQRQGQIAALNALDARQPYDATPFFWSAHYDVTIRYTGHAERWDSMTVSGELTARDARVDFNFGRPRGRGRHGWPGPREPGRGCFDGPRTSRDEQARGYRMTRTVLLTLDAPKRTRARFRPPRHSRS